MVFVFMIYSSFSGQTSPYLTQYILRHLLNNNPGLQKNANQYKQRQNRQKERQQTFDFDPSKLDRKAIGE